MRKSLEQQALRTFLYADVIILMTTKPKKPCKHPGCPRFTNERYCDQHAKLNINDKVTLLSEHLVNTTDY